MKFGASLGRRSIPQWANYNVDYDEIKGLIKEKTTRVAADPLSISGQDAEPEPERPFEDDLFDLLSDQHRRVSLFAKSKYGEIERRLSQLDKQVKQLEGYNTAAAPDGWPVQQTRKFSRLVHEAESIGDEIQYLARFTSTQRLAFEKILKKYQKWTNSPGLSDRFNKEVLHRPNPALQPNFAPPLDYLSDIQSALRDLSTAASQAHSHLHNHQPGQFDGTAVTSPSPSVASKFRAVTEQGSDLDFDVAFSTLPLGQSAGRACYWIHVDNLVEARVLLLRHMRDLITKNHPHVSRTSSASSLSSRRTSVKPDGSGSPKANENVQIALFDDLPKFLREQSGATVNQSEEAPGAIPEKAAMSAYWTENPYALVVTLEPSANPSGISREAKSLQIKRKRLPSLVQSDAAFSKRVTRGSDEKSSSSSEANLEAARHWLSQHPNLQPLAELQTTRARFEGLANSGTSGIWAALDTNISMKTVDTASLGTIQQSRWSLPPGRENDGQSTFPHAVLEVRWEAAGIPEIVNVLDRSHIVERVRGFSLEVHAVVTVCKPQKMPQPFWIPLLRRDIRKIPPARTPVTHQSVSSEAGASSGSRVGNSSSAPSTAEGPSGSGFSPGILTSSATSVRESATEATPASTIRAKKGQDPIFLQVKKDPEPTPVQRYWNEFDDGDERPEDETYTIFIDPNAPSGFPGLETVSKLWATASEKTASGLARFNSFLISRTAPRSDPAQIPLLDGDRFVNYSGIDDTSDSDDGTAMIGRSVPPPQLSTALSRKDSQARRQRNPREKAIFMSYIGCFIASFTLLLLSGILQATGRRRAEIEVDLGVVFGVVMGLGFGIVATGLVTVRREKLSFLHRLAVFLAFSIICIASGVSLAILIRPGD